jgi:LmbE family N-acetylglucosaminyl deacetylase
VLAVRRALALGAHPDDVELQAGGTLAAWAGRGVHVELACFTAGEKGSADPAADPSEASPAELEACQARLVRVVRPDVVLGHDPWRRFLLHPDHRAAGLLTVDGVVAARDPLYAPELAAEGLAAHRPHTVLLFGTDAPDELVEVTATIGAKLASLRAHASQISDHADLERRVRTWNAAIGADAGLQYAEAFHTLDTRGR